MGPSIFRESHFFCFSTIYLPFAKKVHCKENCLLLTFYNILKDGVYTLQGEHHE